MRVAEDGCCNLLCNCPVYLGLFHFNLIFEANPQKWLNGGITMPNLCVPVELG